MLFKFDLTYCELFQPIGGIIFIEKRCLGKTQHDIASFYN